MLFAVHLGTQEIAFKVGAEQALSQAQQALRQRADENFIGVHGAYAQHLNQMADLLAPVTPEDLLEQQSLCLHGSELSDELLTIVPVDDEV